MKPYTHQQKLWDEKPKKTLLCWDTGTGKTVGALGLVNIHCNTAMVVCPKALKEKWKRDTIAFLGEKGYPRVIFVTKEEFRRDWNKLPAVDGLIVDEAHYFAGMKSQMHKSLVKYISKHNPEVIILATATPYMSTPWNIYALAKILGKVWSYIKFKHAFFDEAFIYNRTVPVVKKGIEKEIAALVDKLGSTVHINECADIPDQIFETEKFEPTKEQEKRKETAALEDPNPVVRFTKYHQIENGTLKGDEFVPHEFFDNPKEEYILTMAEGNAKIAVFCRYNLQIDRLKERLKEEKKKVYVIRGDTKNRDQVVQDAEASDNCVVLINAACSEGYELPSFGVILFASLSFSYKDYKQGCGRFLRLNRLKKNVYIHLVSGEIDEAVFGAIMRKQDFSMEIYSRDKIGGTVELSDEETRGNFSIEV